MTTVATRLALSRLTATVLSVALLSTACEGPPTQPDGSQDTSDSLSPAARAYLVEVVGIMEGNSVNRKTIDWTAFRSQVLQAAGVAQTISDTYPAIRVALTLLQDNHSSYVTSAGSTIFVGTITCQGGAHSLPSSLGRIGYVAVPSFSGGGDAAQQLAQSVQNTIRAADADSLIGWAVDLRGNLGGNMWPMVAGVGPVLGEGTAGYFVNPDSIKTPWGYANGTSVLNDVILVRVTNPYTLARPDPWVAVLTDGAVASSGEAVVVAFRARPRTRSFGTPTCGLSTANTGFPLSDGGRLNLTTAVMADRGLTLYGRAIRPDEEITDPAQAAERAAQWLREMNAGGSALTGTTANR